MMTATGKAALRAWQKNNLSCFVFGELQDKEDKATRQRLCKMIWECSIQKIKLMYS